MQIVTPKWKHRNFFDEINAMVPAWQPTNVVDGVAMYETNEPSQRMSGALYYSVHDKPDDGVAAGDPQYGEFSMPFCAYIRMMDEAGNIHPVIIRTGRVPSDDRSGYGTAKVAEKRMKGWLVCESQATAQAMEIVFDTNGKSEAEYAEYLRSEWLARRRKRAAADARASAALRTEAEQHMIEMQQKQTDMIKDQATMTREMVGETVTQMLAALVPEITKAVMAGTAASRK